MCFEQKTSYWGEKELSDKPMLLIVDDDPGLLELLEHSARKNFPDIEIHAVSDGARAREFFATATPDVIVTDVLMPGMGGVELMFMMNSNPKYAKCRVVAITGLEKDDARVVSIKESGLRRIVHKETGFAKRIIEAIGEAIEAHSGAEFNLLEDISSSNDSHYLGVDPDASDGKYAGRTVEKADRNIFNQAALLKSFDNDREVMRVALKSFMSSSEALLEEFEKSLIAGRDAQTASRIAHTLAGSSGSIGGERLRDISSRLEFLLKDGNLEQSASLLAELRNEYTALIAALKESF